MTGSERRPPNIEHRPPIGQTSKEAVDRAAQHRIVQAGEVLRYGARNRSTGEFRYQLWKVVFVQRDEEGNERVYLRFRDLAPENRTVRPKGYAHDSLVNPATHCPACGQPRA
jgi:hypothetical protein